MINWVNFRKLLVKTRVLFQNSVILTQKIFNSTFFAAYSRMKYPFVRHKIFAIICLSFCKFALVTSYVEKFVVNRLVIFQGRFSSQQLNENNKFAEIESSQNNTCVEVVVQGQRRLLI